MDELTCHLTQAGLKLGLPFLACSLVVKTYSTFSSLTCRALTGGVLSGYVTTGNLSKMRFKGGGIEKRLRFGVADPTDDPTLCGNLEMLSRDARSSFDIAVHC